MPRFRQTIAILALAALPAAALAQGTQVSIGPLALDSGLPVEVTAEALSVDQENGNAVFSGGVTVVQGAMTLEAGEVRVEYATTENDTGSGISKMLVSGGVTLLNGGDAAQAQEATYDLAAAQLIMQGSVVLTQGPTTISADRFVIDLATGAGRMEGNVRTVFQTRDN
ncbi:MAG: LptA/OstA family protein [Pseudomonadota bacterium]